MTSFDFTSVFQRIGALFVTELKALMYAQRGVDGSTYAPLAPATIRQKLAVSSATASQRMIRTKDFVNNAFNSEASASNVRVFVSPELHGRDLKTARKASTKAKLAAAAIPYNEIAEYQLPTGSSKFFPLDDADVAGMKSFQRAKEMLLEEAVRQAREKFTLHIRTELHIG